MCGLGWRAFFNFEGDVFVVSVDGIEVICLFPSRKPPILFRTLRSTLFSFVGGSFATFSLSLIEDSFRKAEARGSVLFLTP